MYTIKTRALGLLLTGLMLLTFSGWAPVPANARVIEVATVDELVAAIGPNTDLALLPGAYDLSAAVTYGKDTGNPHCRWEIVSEDGFELCITGVSGLTFRGAGMDQTTLLAQDRYANVLTFDGCQNVAVSALTAGHDPAPGYCSGGVLRCVNCRGVTVERCGLFGCGTIGVWASNCGNLTVAFSRIYECSDSAVNADSCRNVLVEDCEIDHNGWKNDFSASGLFTSYGGDGFTVSGCRIHDNTADLLLNSSYTRNMRLLSCQVDYNALQNAFGLYGVAATVDGCAFHGNDIDDWYVESYEQASLAARDMQGKTLSEDDLEAMALREIRLPEAEPAPSAPVEVASGGEITVTNVDEFLAAIGPERTILLAGESFCLADAATYGSVGGQYYRWEECFDGPQLVISGVSNLAIRAADPESVTALTAVPRYANVLGFQSCENVAISGLTLGHTEGSSECAGAVLSFEGCSGIAVHGCFLYGCGTLGVDAWYCSGLEIRECEIYDCSIGGVVLGSVYDVTFEGCFIHDVPSPAVSLYGCDEVMWNNADMPGEHYDVTADGELLPVVLG